MSAPTLTAEDIDLLLKALSAYQQEPVNDGMKEMMLTAMIERDKTALEREGAKIMARVKEDTRKLEEVIIMLKAKCL